MTLKKYDKVLEETITRKLMEAGIPVTGERTEEQARQVEILTREAEQEALVFVNAAQAKQNS
jgi:hypothetical protein